jgi:hypothetical protein
MLQVSGMECPSMKLSPASHNNIPQPVFTTPNLLSHLSEDQDHLAVTKPFTEWDNLSFLCTTPLTEKVGKEYFTYRSNSYRGVRYLKEEGGSAYTYQLPEGRPSRLVIGELHLTMPPNALNKEINVRAVHPTAKTPLPLFFIDLVPSLKNKAGSF